jgi:hypothetical protein
MSKKDRTRTIEKITLRHYNVVAILDTMWGTRKGSAPRYFRINPLNTSGRRLYALAGQGANLLVTNACRELVTSADVHGRPDPVWLASNLVRIQQRWAIDVILVCGVVAQRAFDQSLYQPAVETSVFRIPHPAARIWTTELTTTTQCLIQRKQYDAGAKI